MTETLRAAFVIARRDFVATVFRRTFLFFLLGPLLPVGMGFMLTGLGAQIAVDAARPTIAVVARADQFDLLARAHDRLAATTSLTTIDLIRAEPAADPVAQRGRLLARTTPPIVAVMEGGLDHPRLIGAIGQDGNAFGQLQHMIDDARLSRLRPDQSLGNPIALDATVRASGSVVTGHDITARAGQFILFFLTIFLAGAVLSQLVEEKTNKVIEILAAAVPVNAIFVGKLFSMLAISCVGVAVWTFTGAMAIAGFSAGGLATLPAPAVGWTLFLFLAAGYFAMTYLLIGSVFLGIGSQAESVREIQTLNMPVVLAQSALLGFAMTTVGHLDEPRGLVGAIFPLSSPLTMVAWAAEKPQIWPHLVALAWQALWVALILRLAAALFRRNVLKSGRPWRWPWQRKVAG